MRPHLTGIQVPIITPQLEPMGQHNKGTPKAAGRHHTGSGQAMSFCLKSNTNLSLRLANKLLHVKELDLWESRVLST